MPKNYTAEERRWHWGTIEAWRNSSWKRLRSVLETVV